MKNSDSGAFPATPDAFYGLTKREYFAGLAMQGWLARCANVPHHAKLEPFDMAQVAVSMADALIKELNK